MHLAETQSHLPDTDDNWRRCRYIGVDFSSCESHDYLTAGGALIRRQKSTKWRDAIRNSIYSFDVTKIKKNEGQFFHLFFIIPKGTNDDVY